MKEILKNIIESAQMPEGTAWTRKQYQTNDIIVKEGDPGTTLFFVEEGELRVSGRVEVGDKKHIQPGIGDLTEGTLFGESCLHATLPRIATVTAVSDASLLEINGEKLNAYLDANPTHGFIFYKTLFEIIMERLQTSKHTVESLMAWGLKAHEMDKYL